ncbi:MAG TPA: hypothetical protein VEH62_03495 [Gemmatimonadales bacterium]|nr:hypothetical protein [Gemmatimonadales bacterium]
MVPRLVALLALVVLADFAACNNPFQLPPANLAVTSDTVTLWALTGTDVSRPSAYSVFPVAPFGIPDVVRTDRSSGFDFAFDIRTDTVVKDTTAVLLPRGAMGLYVDGGLQVTTQTIDQVTLAPTSGYQDTLAVPVKVGTVVLVASRSQTCNFGYIRPYYAKLVVTSLDFVARSIAFLIYNDSNCGYRSLKADSLPPTE